ncbi:adenosylmethionine decarboxylase [Neisseriaceae bacterium B1]
MSAYLPGQHGLLDLYGCNADILRDKNHLEIAMRQAAQAAGAQILFAYLHQFGDNQGMTGVLLLAESHLSIHTWPEWNFAAIDIFLCGNLQPEQAKNVLQQALQAQTVQWQVLPRGVDLA